MESLLIENLTLRNLSSKNILLDDSNTNFYIIIKRYLSNELFLEKNSDLIIYILNLNIILSRSDELYFIKNNFSILTILENEKINKAYKDRKIIINTKNKINNSNVFLFRETSFLIKSLSGYGSHLMHASIYKLLKAQLTKDDCIELFGINKFTINDYIKVVGISQSTFDRSRSKTHE